MTDRMAVNGAELHYRLDGPEAAPTVVLSNSLMSNLEMWEPQMAALTETFRVLRFDTRGHGASSVPAAPYSIAAMAGDVIGLMDALEIDRAHFCGLSMGGMIGQVLGAKHADRLESLTLCDTAAHMPPPELWDERIAVARTEGLSAAVPATLERWFTEPFRASGHPAIERIAEMIQATDVDGFAACAGAIRDMDHREMLAEITVPTLVIVGRDDPGTPVAAAEVLRDGIAGAELVILDDAAHLCNIEQPGAFNAALLAFLDGQTAESAEA